MRTRHFASALFASLLFAVCAEVSGQTKPTVIGVLEDNPGHYAGEGHYRDVRVVFRRERGSWVAFPSNCPDQNCLKTIAAQFPPEMKWIVAFDGKAVGELEGRTPRSFDFYSTIGQQTIISGSEVPTVGKRSAKFGGFLGEAVHRPLVAVSEPNYRDPEDWKPNQLTSDMIAAVRKAFRGRNPKVTNCTKQGIEDAKPWPYSDVHITVRKSYASNRRWYLAEVLLSGYECDGPSDEPFSSQWFVITPERRVRFLDSSMWLVDAGDYDNDGKAELVFSIDDYNRGGYKLFYDDFKQKAVFEFSYH